MGLEFTMTRTDPFSMGNGTRIRRVGRVRCYSQMVLTMTADGMEIRCMAKEFTFHAQGTGLKGTSAMV